MSFTVKCYKIQPNNITRWVVLGKNKEYLVTHSSCTCRDFLLKITKKEVTDCKHILFLKNALKTKEFDEYSITIQEFKIIRDYLMEFKK